MRFFICVGTRPECIKMAPVILELKRRIRTGDSVTVCHSGQHEKMADDVLSFFGIEPNIRFSAMRESQSLSELSVRLLDFFDMAIKREQPDIVLVHGDTTTAFCASLAAFYRGVRVAHVESGLRTFDTLAPYPEEFNRVAVDSISDICFAPTQTNAQNLEKEGKKCVFTVGNTVIDTFKYTLKKDYSSPLLDLAAGRRLVLLTTHRRENRGRIMSEQLLAVRELLEELDDALCVLPCHPGREVREVVEPVFENVKNIKICEPLQLFDFHNLLWRASAVISDSGGIQEEAAYLGIPLFLLREVTERQEAVGKNCVLLGTDAVHLRAILRQFFCESDRLDTLRISSNVFGTGDTAGKIVDLLLEN